MYKPLHEDLRRSAKHAAASPWASTVWFLLLPHVDPAGRFPASPILVRSTAFPLRRERLNQVEAALQELAHLGLIHLYESGGERYLVFHDHAEWVKALRGSSPKFPAPPPDLCRCCRMKPKEAEGGGKAASPTHSLPFSCAVEEGLERVQGKPGGSTAPGEPVRMVAARAFKAANGGKQSVAGLADHFVSLENSGASAEFVLAEIPKKYGEAAWTCCDRVREAWKTQQARRAETPAPVAEVKPAPATIAQLEKYRETLLNARAKGLKVGQEEIDHTEERIAALRAAGATK